MKLIIDIDKDVYKLFTGNGQGMKVVRFNLENALKNGTPLEEEFKNIKDEIEEQKLDVDLDIGNEIIYNNAINDVLQIIDRHIS